MQVPTDKIREVIGSRGAVIKEICATSGAVVDVSDDGTIKISSNNNEAIKKAMLARDKDRLEPLRDIKSNEHIFLIGVFLIQILLKYLGQKRTSTH